MSSSSKKYDAFISFRGEDTRTNFTSHLHSSLCREGIHVYIDDRLQKGKDVWKELSQAIEESNAAVVVFSKNYANSKWCLEELVKILECRERNGQVVIPVFYEVDPSDIRNQTGTYGEAMDKHKQALGDNKNEDLQHKLSEWRAALNKAGKISGRDTRSREYKNHSQVIDKIVKDVLDTLELRFPIELKVKNLAGFEKLCEDVESLLFRNRKNDLLENVQVIGIWGMGGIGKTTIAKAIFSQHFPHYESVCFLGNVREASQNNNQRKLTSLREKLLSELLKDATPQSRGSAFITRRLSTKKVFIVLDDVDSSDQLDALCGECSYGEGSKLIITTRNRHLLSGRINENDIYKVRTWNLEESLELFSLNAFNKRHPDEGYEKHSKRAVDYCGGVPLALKVLGSNLRARSTEFWDSELEKVKNYPYDEIRNVLQVSYDGLDIPQKKIFLDIAFFFKGEDQDFVERILNACGFSATSGIKVLEDKALITISSGMGIQMHDLAQDMGLNLVRHGIVDPGKRSRLRDLEEVSDVLEYKKKGSDAVEGIQLDLSQIDDLHLNNNSFIMMTELRFLKLYIPSGKRSGKVDYPISLNQFSCKLRYLEWNGCGLKSLPETLYTKMLVEIRMPCSHVTELWQGVKDVMNLERIDLRECKKLKNLPDLSKASKLKWVNLSGCESLATVHPSVLSHDTLETLILDGCKKLNSLKSEKHLISLKNISVNGCTNLKEFSVSSDSMMRLDLSNAGIEKLHSSIGRSSDLRYFTMEGLRLRNVPSELSFLKDLWSLEISNCKLLVIDKQKLHALFDGLRKLAVLYLKDCIKISELPENISVLSNLYKLRLDGSGVETLPASIKHLSRLETLSLENCRRLRCLPELPTNIKEFYAVNCTLLVRVSTLKTFATVMEGKTKYISFKNCKKLDELSLHRIMEGVLLSTINAIFQNVHVRRIGLRTHSYNYNNVQVCFPGSSVPGQFTYRTAETSFTINLPSRSNLLGLVLCVVLSPSSEMKKDGVKIFCQCYEEDRTKSGYPSSWNDEAIKELNCDHVYLWYHAFHYYSTAEYYERKVTFEFYVTNCLGERDVLNVPIKECGVRLVIHSELDNLVRELELDFESKWKLASDLGVELSSELRLELESQQRATLMTTERSEKNECDDINLQERKICSCSCDCLLDVLRYFWRSICT